MRAITMRAITMHAIIMHAKMSTAGIAVGLILLSATVSVRGVDESDKPDVLFLVVDDLNDWISLLDPDAPIKTPNLERLAKRGVLFTRAYCASPACNPSRVATLTGLRPSTTGVYGNRSDWRGAIPDRRTIMQQFLAAGYDVRGAGKIFHHHLDGAFHDDASFHHFQQMRPQVYPPKKLNNAPDYGSRNTDWGAWPKRAADSIDFLTASYCVTALNQPVGNKPLFLACGIFKPHSPFFAPAAFHTPYADIVPPIRKANDWSDLPPGAELLLRSKKWFWQGMTKVEQQQRGSYQDFIRAYAASATFADAQIGRVLDALDNSPRRDNTVIVLWSDHGFHLGEKDHIEKFALWEKSNRIPFVIVAPGVASPGSRCDRPIDLTAVYPTLLELGRLPADTQCDGRSVVPLLRDPKVQWDRPALMTYLRGNHAVRSDRWRYIRYRDGSEELYDHASDPNEWNNLAGRKQLAEVIRSHRKWLPEGEAKPAPDLMALPQVEAPRKDRGGSKSTGNKHAPVEQSDDKVSAQSKPNVLFLAVDDMKDWVNCLGGYEGTVHTPNIDRFAERGMLFRNAHCPSPKCAPSRAAIMTGLRPSTTGLYDNGHWWLPNLPDAVTIPKKFRDNGYHVVGAGKVFHHTAGNHPPNQWDDFFRLTFREDPWFRSVKLNYPWSEPSPYPTGFPFSGVQGLGHENDWGSLAIPDQDYDDALTTAYAVQFLGGQHDKPFFLACGQFRPHLPWYVPQQYFDMYPVEDVVLPRVREDDLDDLPTEGREFARARRSDFETIQNADKWKHAVRAYLASITCADARLGRVLDELDRSPYTKNTIVVLWSDHGWHLGEKQHWHKSTLWEEATHVPLIIAAPGHQPGVCDRPVSLLDLYPTLNELAGLEADESHDGVTLTPLLRDPSAEWNRPAVIEFKRGNAAVRSDRYRYILYRNGGEELYDHQTDPYEWNNLADSKDHASIKKDLASWIAKQWAKPAPTKGAFHFDLDTFTWTHKVTGKTTNGRDP